MFEDRIDNIMKEMKKRPLSDILVDMLSLALDCYDYEGYYILSCWLNPLSDSKEGNILRNDIAEALHNLDLNEDAISNISCSGAEKYISMRSIETGKMCALSAKELEDSLKRCGDMLQINSAFSPPQSNLGTYIEIRNSKINAINKILENQKMYEKQYAILHSFISNKLAYYRQKEDVRIMKSSILSPQCNSKNVFIIHGHSEAKLLELEKILKDEFQLNPIILKDKPDNGLTIVEKFEKYAVDCSYAFALFTPDDIVSDGEQQYFQARPNVIFELGWFYAHLGRSRVCILEQASEKSVIFSDLQGVMRVQFNQNISEEFIRIRRELGSVGLI